MRRVLRCCSLSCVAIILLLCAAASHAQRLSVLTPGPPIGNFGCSGGRCFSSVSGIDGDTAIVGFDGVAVIVRGAPGVWTLQQELWNPAGIRYEMGRPAALSGDTVLATGTSGIYNFAPVIYVWQRAGTTWTHTQVLAVPRSVGAYEVRVLDVALTEGAAAICSIHVGPAENRQARIDMFRRLGDGRYQRQAQLVPPITLGADLTRDCGLALEGNTLLVADSMANQAAGRVLAYQSGTSGWTLRRTLAAPDSTSGSRFGTSIAMSGNTIAVGAPRRPNFDQPLHLGAAYVFQRTASNWALVQLLVKPESPGEEPQESEFARDVTLSGDRMSISWSSGEAPRPPAYLYERRGVWAPVAELLPQELTGGGAARISGSSGIQTLGDVTGSGNVAYEFPELWTLPPRVEGP